MAYDPTSGQSLTGTQLPPVPPNAKPEDQIAVLNQMIEVLNNYSRDVVQSGAATLSLAAGFNQGILTITHNLGFKPQAYVYLDNVSYGGTPSFINVNVPLPTFLSSGSDGTNITFGSWMDYFVDSTNLYVRLRLGAVQATDINRNLRYYLTRNPAA